MATPFFVPREQVILDKAIDMGSKSKQHPDQKHEEKDRWLVHRDWRIYLGVVLMIIAAFVYLATQDESVGPGGAVSQQVPAAPGP